jgi:pimeloyl-ACP methyl ester carboxylesterase
MIKLAPRSQIPLVLAPGLACDVGVWWHQIAALGSSCHIQVTDYDMADSLAAMARKLLAEAPPRFALAGHSMGGRVALEVMARAPERVERLALLDTGFEAVATGEAGERERIGRYRLLDVARRQGMAEMAREWARGMVHPAHRADERMMDDIHQMLARSTPEQFEAQLKALLRRPNRAALLPTLGIPTLVLCGHEDSWSPIERHEDLASRIPGSVLVDVPQCGHMSTLEQPEIVSAALQAWLEDRPQLFSRELYPRELDDGPARKLLGL